MTKSTGCQHWSASLIRPPCMLAALTHVLLYLNSLLEILCSNAEQQRGQSRGHSVKTHQTHSEVDGKQCCFLCRAIGDDANWCSRAEAGSASRLIDRARKGPWANNILYFFACSPVTHCTSAKKASPARLLRTCAYVPPDRMVCTCARFSPQLGHAISVERKVPPPPTDSDMRLSHTASPRACASRRRCSAACTAAGARPRASSAATCEQHECCVQSGHGKHYLTQVPQALLVPGRL